MISSLSSSHYGAKSCPNLYTWRLKPYSQIGSKLTVQSRSLQLGSSSLQHKLQHLQFTSGSLPAQSVTKNAKSRPSQTGLASPVKLLESKSTTSLQSNGIQRKPKLKSFSDFETRDKAFSPTGFIHNNNEMNHTYRDLSCPLERMGLFPSIHYGLTALARRQQC